jgi:hypothetical protein
MGRQATYDRLREGRYSEKNHHWKSPGLCTFSTLPVLNQTSFAQKTHHIDMLYWDLSYNYGKFKIYIQVFLMTYLSFSLQNTRCLKSNIFIKLFSHKVISTLSDEYLSLPIVEDTNPSILGKY